MKRTDHILLFTSNLLTLSEETFTKVYQDFSIRYELDEIGKPDKVSIAGRGVDDRKDSFNSWIHDLRKEGVEKVRLYWEIADESSLPSHIENAFAGSQELLLEVTTAKNTKAFYLQSFYSSMYDIQPEQFVKLIDYQKNKKVLWDRVSELLTEGNELNNRPIFDSADVRNYIVKDKDCPFDMMVSQLLTEVQIECIILESPFDIPKGLESLFYKSDFSFGLPEEEDKEYVYLYPLKEISVDELLKLIEAQSFSKEDIWKKMTEVVKDYNDPSIPELELSDWPAYIQTKSPSELSMICSAVCRAICLLCEENKIARVIPDSLSQSFGPDELENKRAKARSRISQDQWYIKSNEHPWELYFFEWVRDVSAPNEIDEKALKVQLTKTLKEISDFAKKIESEYWEPFALGHYLLSNAAPSGNFDEAHLTLIKKDLISRGFSEIALENFEHAFLYYSDDLKSMNQTEKIYGLLAVSFCDVFGGMGSWNDLYVEGEEDNQLYQTLSSNVFIQLKQYFAALLSA